jgi:hypothetical protein
MQLRMPRRAWTILLELSVAIAFVLGLGSASCNQPATRRPAPALPESPWGGRYAYSYDLPADIVRPPAGSVPITVAVVNPSYRETDSSVLASPMYSGIGKGLTVSMGTDLDKVLIAKGITTTGPFTSSDEITYSEKKGSDLTLAPRVFIAAESRLEKPHRIRGAARWEVHFTLSVTGWITFIMQESMTGEKMWIKKLELEPVLEDGVIIQRQVPNSGEVKVLYDGRPDAMATAMKELYPLVLSRFYKYLETDEMLQLKDRSKEIRATKVYTGN